MNDAAPKTILIVEDDPGTQLLLVALMRRSQLEPVVASNGHEAITVLRQQRFAVVILDLMMPGANGHEVIAFLQSEKRNERVVVCTAAGPRSTDGIDASSVAAIVRKPFDIDEFAAIIANALKDAE
jgi:DNA-binding response OmpR family regulator